MWIQLDVIELRELRTNQTMRVLPRRQTEKAHFLVDFQLIQIFLVKSGHKESFTVSGKFPALI